MDNTQMNTELLTQTLRGRCDQKNKNKKKIQANINFTKNL